MVSIRRRTVDASTVGAVRRTVGFSAVVTASLVLAGAIVFQLLHATGITGEGFANWRPVAYAYLLWAIAVGAAQLLVHRERGARRLFLLPALFLTLAFLIFPALFQFYLAFTDWNLSSFAGRQFNGLANLRTLLLDADYRNALLNMVWYSAAVLPEYALAFMLALLLNAGIKAKRFFGTVFLLPFLLSPVAVGWIVGRSILESRYGPAARLARFLGWENPTFFGPGWMARLSIELMDAWVFVPFVTVLLLAGLRALPRDLLEAAEIDGATPWQSFWRITFPLTLPVSITAIVLRLIFKLKLADIVITLTSGGPGGATDTASSYIYRVYANRSQVGYGSMLAVSYLILVLLLLAGMLALAGVLLRRFSISHAVRAEEGFIALPAARERPPRNEADFRPRAGIGRVPIYAGLVAWSFICLFPIYWTVTSSLKSQADVMRGSLVPLLDFMPSWRGWRSIGLSPDTIGQFSSVREDLIQRFCNSIAASIGGASLALVVGALAAYGLARFPQKFGPMRNKDLSFFFLSQLIVPPVVLAIPFLVLYKALELLDTPVGLILAYALMVLPIVIWIMRDHMRAVPIELEEAAQIDGLGPWGIFSRIVLPLVRPGLAAAFILSFALCWNEYFLASLLTSFHTQTLPAMIASQSGTQGLAWWSMGAISTVAIAPLVAIGIVFQPYLVRGMTVGLAR